jgi:mRNA-degrading endonuclease RelE of RelBE toxin-antitoxin system
MRYTALRKLFHLNRATTLRALALLPGNRLEALEGNRKGQYSIRINDQYRICFGWNDTNGGILVPFFTSCRRAKNAPKETGLSSPGFPPCGRSLAALFP